ncbi:response regulator [Aminiphilus sp.]|uniref:hybrid sensor histidine kinase/response regulator n=1 Tax=Aminiphilus sp. TaxID=1872488 RepID=UPI00262FC2C6|nr:response regulator [Aminiphilus sp.]
MKNRILLIEDEGELLANVGDLLELEGYTVLKAASGEEGIRLAKAALPDLIVCDILMPGVDGYGVLKTLRDSPATADIPFIFLTARARAADVRSGMERGADDYVTKPFSGETLLRAVAARLTRQTLQESATAARYEELRGNLSRALPHELFTPLTILRANAERLRDEWEHMDNGQRNEHLDAILRASDRLCRITKNNLLYARLEIAHKDATYRRRFLQGETLSFRQSLSGVADRTAAEHGRTSDLSLRIDADATLPVVDEHFRKIAEELLSNAFKFSSPGTAVTVRATVGEGVFRLSVHDEGSGMTSSQVERIGAYVQFDRQFLEQQGAGLGLILAKRLAELHRGTFSVESAPDEGTTVTVVLPLKRRRPRAGTSAGEVLPSRS